ncbi:MAG TPA: hypothetical protein VIK35_11245 [Verrucomicrobiae bacterium]
MTTAQEIIREAARRNICLEPEGERLVCHFNGTEIPPDFERKLKANKPALIAHLKIEHARILHLSKQILLNEHGVESRDREAIYKLFRELKNFQHPQIQRAREILHSAYRASHESKLDHDSRTK